MKLLSIDVGTFISRFAFIVDGRTIKAKGNIRSNKFTPLIKELEDQYGIDKIVIEDDVGSTHDDWFSTLPKIQRVKIKQAFESPSIKPGTLLMEESIVKSIVEMKLVSVYQDTKVIIPSLANDLFFALMLAEAAELYFSDDGLFL